MRVNTCLFIFNVFDTIGRIIPNFYMLSIKSVEQIILYRIVFFILFGLLYSFITYDYLSKNIVSILSITVNICFALSNGYLTSVLFSYGPSLVKDKYKGQAGSAVCLFLISGMFTGSLFSMFVTLNLI